MFLYWVVSCDDIFVINVLFDQGVDVEVIGGVIVNGILFIDVVVFRQWNVVRRLLDYGYVKLNLNSVVVLGLLDYLEKVFCYDDLIDDGEKLLQQDLDYVFWYVCYGGQFKVV